MGASYDVGQSNLNRGHYEAAFNIFIDLVQYELHDGALYALTKMCFEGNLNAEQLEKFYALQNSASALGNGYALFNVGLMHERGVGKLPQDFKVAVEYYLKAVKEEVTDAYCNLGNIYALGLGMEQGIPPNVELGIQYLEKGAEEGSRQCAFTLGSLYGQGELIPQDLRMSFYYLSLAALQGHMQSKRVLMIFANTHKEDYSQELSAAQATFGKIENLRKLYKSI
jgi:TPR repeat protein